MGFLKKKLDQENQEIQGRKHILVSTLLTSDQPFETIGLVNVKVRMDATNLDAVIEKIKEKASAVGADAILGFHTDQYMSAFKWMDQIAYGTAVRYKTTDPEQVEMQGI